MKKNVLILLFLSLCSFASPMLNSRCQENSDFEQLNKILTGIKYKSGKSFSLINENGLQGVEALFYAIRNGSAYDINQVLLNKLVLLSLNKDIATRAMLEAASTGNILKFNEIIGNEVIRKLLFSDDLEFFEKIMLSEQEIQVKKIPSSMKNYLNIILAMQLLSQIQLCDNKSKEWDEFDLD